MTTRSVERLLADLALSTASRSVALGRYDVIGRLGRGGMGTVYEAIDRERGTKVALKTLSVADAAGSVLLKREFRVVADLAHPNLAPVYELGSDGGIWFFTMEHIEGESLTRWARPEHELEPAAELPLSRTLATPREVQRTLRSAGVETAPAVAAPLDLLTRRDSDSEESMRQPTRDLASTDGKVSEGPERASPPTREMTELRRVFRELVGAVAALHEAGLRHGDIKPANILVRPDGRVVVVDFGLAGPVFERGGVRAPSGGTPVFMAPEQFANPRATRSESIGPAADWYAVGATLYRVLTGLLPFSSASLLDLYIKKNHQLPAPPHVVSPTTPLDLSQLCMRLLAPTPSERPSTEELLRFFADVDDAAEAAGSSHASTRMRRTRFVGRDRELALLEHAYGAARAGTPTVVHVHGPSGIGKSALLSHFLEAIGEIDSALVLRGRCYERETVPYKAFDRIVDELASELSRMGRDEVAAMLPAYAGELGRAFPALASIPEIAARAASKHVAHDAMELRRRSWIALAQLFGALREKRPVVLAIDDFQWSDEDSVHLLGALVEGGAETALLIVILLRPQEASANAALSTHFATCKRLAREDRFIDLGLEGLSAAEAVELAREALSDAPESEGRARFLAEEARGVPFFIEELAHYLVQKGADYRAEEISLEGAILARVAALPPDQRALVEVAAVAANPLPQSICFEAARLEQGSLMPLLVLRSASLVRWLGASADNVVSIYHDRIRESVVGAMSELEQKERHLAIGRALAKRRDGGARGWLFDAVRHLRAAADLIVDLEERLEVAELHALAGARAQAAAAYPLAFDCFEGGSRFLPPDAWTTNYSLALRLSAGAIEASYLTASWETLDRHVAELKAHARSAIDELPAWQAEIDKHVGRHQYLAALDAGLDVLERLGVVLPRDPGVAEVGGNIEATVARLMAIGRDGLLTKPDLTDPGVIAATHIQVRLGPAAYFGKPMLLPIIACNLIRTSIERGLSAATPYALALFGIVLNTIDLYPMSHEWGTLALRLLERWPDRRLEAATKHILYNLVCCWTVPLSSVLDELRRVFDLGCQTGDYEYASYAAHGYVHNAMYAGRPLEPLSAEAAKLGREMRALGQVNAVHVHAPFEQLLKGLTGRLADPSRLDDESYSESTWLAQLEAEGSRSGVYVLLVAMGLARWFFGDPAEASACFERAKTYLNAAPSVWHGPIMHQYGALSACLSLATTDDATRRAKLESSVAASLRVLRKLATFSEANFAHRVALVEGALAGATGDHARALTELELAAKLAHEQGWVSDVAVAHELAARFDPDPQGARRHLRSARAAYAAWGAKPKADALSSASAASS
ncbi:MAG: AAA family ATPase [Polyangiaceae bacterium]